MENTPLIIQVVQWFTSTNSAVQQRYNRTIPSLAFVHIPVHASFSFQQEGVDAHKEPGINDDNPLAHQGITCVDNVCTYTGQDIPFMSALANTPGMMAMFSGHDHGNDWCAFLLLSSNHVAWVDSAYAGASGGTHGYLI